MSFQLDKWRNHTPHREDTSEDCRGRHEQLLLRMTCARATHIGPGRTCTHLCLHIPAHLHTPTTCAHTHTLVPTHTCTPTTCTHTYNTLGVHTPGTHTHNLHTHVHTCAYRYLHTPTTCTHLHTAAPAHALHQWPPTAPRSSSQNPQAPNAVHLSPLRNHPSRSYG